MVRWALFLHGCASDHALVPEPSWGTPQLVPNPAPEVRTDTVVAGAEELDLVVVLDISCSMEDEQDLVLRWVPTLVGLLRDSGADWRLGVIDSTGDLVWGGRLHTVWSGGEERRWVDDDTPDAESVFTLMLDFSDAPGISGIDERFRKAGWMAVDLADTVNAGFFREDAALRFLAFSDGDDVSGDEPLSLDELPAWAAALPQPSVTWSAVAYTRDCPDPLFVEGDLYGDELQRMVDLTGGRMEPWCAEDWSDGLRDIVGDAVGRTSELWLTRRPAPGTLRVFLERDGVTQAPVEGRDWTWDPVGNGVHLAELPAPGTTISATYEVER